MGLIIVSGGYSASSIRTTTNGFHFIDCPWINTCVTDRTMKPFLGLIVSSIAIFSVQIGFLIYTRIESPSAFESTGTVVGVVILSLLPAVAILWLWFLLLSLAYFRVYLGLSTYEYLKKTGEVRGQKAMEKESKRIEDRRTDIEKEQAAIREEWRRQREKEQASRREKDQRTQKAAASVTANDAERPNSEAQNSKSNPDSFFEEVAIV